MKFLTASLVPSLRRLVPRRASAFLLLGLALVVSACSAPAGESWPGLTVDKDGKFAYVASKEQIFRVDLTTHRMSWWTQLPSSTHTYTNPALSPDGSTVYVGAFDDKIYAYNTATGLPVNSWNPPKTDEKVIGSALVTSNRVYNGMGDKGLRVYDFSGNEVGRFTDPKFGVWATPVLSDDGKTLYVPSLDHFVYALDPNNVSNVLWKVDAGGALGGTPLILNGNMYVGTFNNEFLAISLAQKKVVARYATRGWVWATPVVYSADDKTSLLFGDLNGWLYSLDIVNVNNENGGSFKSNWEVTDTDHPGSIRGAVVIVKNLTTTTSDKPVNAVIAGSESRYLRAYNVDNGQVVWTAAISTEDRILSDLFIVGNDVVFTTLSDNQIVAAFDIHNGAPEPWKINLGDSKNDLATRTLLPPTAMPTPGATSASTAAPTQAATPASTGSF